MATSGLLYYYHTEKQFHSAIALLQRSLNWSDIFYVGIRSILFFPLSFTLDLGSPKYSFLQYCSHTKIVITFYFVSHWAVFFFHSCTIARPIKNCLLWIYDCVLLFYIRGYPNLLISVQNKINYIWIPLSTEKILFLPCGPY